jgi:hypothetical protein
MDANILLTCQPSSAVSAWIEANLDSLLFASTKSFCPPKHSTFGQLDWVVLIRVFSYSAAMDVRSCRGHKKVTYSTIPGPFESFLITRLTRDRLNDRSGERLAKQNRQDALVLTFTNLMNYN